MTIKNFIELLEGRNVNTARSYKYSLEDFYSFLHSNQLPGNAQSVGFYVNHLLAKKNSPKTIASRLDAIRSYFVFDNISTVGIKSPPVFQKELRVLEVDELRRFLISCEQVRNPTVRALFKIWAFTGLRITESTLLLHSDIVQRESTFFIKVRGEIAKHGKERMIPLNDYVKNVLIEYTKSAGIGPDDRLFPVEVSNMSKQLRTLGKKIGLPFLHPHIFRHTFATLLIDKGVDIKTVQDLCGHSNINTTMRYVHSRQEKKVEATKRLESVIKKTVLEELEE